MATWVTGRSRTAIVRAAAVLVLAWPLAGEAGTTDLSGTNWSVTGRARVSGLAHRGRRWLPFREGRQVQIDASFTSATEFTAHDHVGWDYAGTYAQRGRRGANVRLTFDAGAEAEFDDMLASWLSGIAEEQATVEPRRNAVSMTIHGNRANVVLNRRFTATTATAKARGLYTLRAKALRQ